MEFSLTMLVVWSNCLCMARQTKKNGDELPKAQLATILTFLRTIPPMLIIGGTQADVCLPACSPVRISHVPHPAIERKVLPYQQTPTLEDRCICLLTRISYQF